MNKIKFNISNAHVAVKTVDADGKVSFSTPFAVPGSVSISLEAKGDIMKFYADGVVYYKASENNGYEGDWELALIPEKFRQEILKEVLDKNKVLLEKQGVEGAEFAFGCQIDGDTKNTRFWFYNCTASRPATNGTTNEESKTPQTDKLSIVAAGEKVVEGSDDYYVRAKTTNEVESTVYDNWFKSVYIPTFETTTP